MNLPRPPKPPTPTPAASTPVTPVATPTTTVVASTPDATPSERADLILAVPSIELARRLMSDAKAWQVKPSSGQGVVRIRVVVDPNLPTEIDATWLQAQLVVGLGFSPTDIEPATLIWSDPT